MGLQGHCVQSSSSSVIFRLSLMHNLVKLLVLTDVIAIAIVSMKQYSYCVWLQYNNTLYANYRQVLTGLVMKFRNSLI